MQEEKQTLTAILEDTLLSLELSSNLQDLKGFMDKIAQLPVPTTSSLEKKPLMSPKIDATQDNYSTLERIKLNINRVDNYLETTGNSILYDIHNTIGKPVRDSKSNLIPLTPEQLQQQLENFKLITERVVELKLLHMQAKINFNTYKNNLTKQEKNQVGESTNQGFSPSQKVDSQTLSQLHTKILGAVDKERKPTQGYAITSSSSASNSISSSLLPDQINSLTMQEKLVKLIDIINHVGAKSVIPSLDSNEKVVGFSPLFGVYYEEEDTCSTLEKTNKQVSDFIAYISQSAYETLHDLPKTIRTEILSSPTTQLNDYRKAVIKLVELISISSNAQKLLLAYNKEVQEQLRTKSNSSAGNEPVLESKSSDNNSNASLEDIHQKNLKDAREIIADREKSKMAQQQPVSTVNPVDLPKSPEVTLITSSLSQLESNTSPVHRGDSFADPVMLPRSSAFWGLDRNPMITSSSTSNHDQEASANNSTNASSSSSSGSSIILDLKIRKNSNIDHSSSFSFASQNSLDTLQENYLPTATSETDKKSKLVRSNKKSKGIVGKLTDLFRPTPTPVPRKLEQVLPKNNSEGESTTLNSRDKNNNSR